MRSSALSQLRRVSLLRKSPTTPAVTTPNVLLYFYILPKSMPHNWKQNTSSHLHVKVGKRANLVPQTLLEEEGMNGAGVGEAGQALGENLGQSLQSRVREALGNKLQTNKAGPEKSESRGEVRGRGHLRAASQGRWGYSTCYTKHGWAQKLLSFGDALRSTGSTMGTGLQEDFRRQHLP